MLLIDTCVLIWLTGTRERLSPAALKALDDDAGNLTISAISALEIGLAVKKRRLALLQSPIEWFSDVTKRFSMEVRQVNWEIAAASAALPDMHSDPFDRLIIATAMAQNVQVVTPDPDFVRYPGITVVW